MKDQLEAVINIAKEYLEGKVGEEAFLSGLTDLCGSIKDPDDIAAMAQAIAGMFDE